MRFTVPVIGVRKMMGWDRAMEGADVDVEFWVSRIIIFLSSAVSRYVVGYLELSQKMLKKSVETLFVVIICNGNGSFGVKKGGKRVVFAFFWRNFAGVAHGFVCCRKLSVNRWFAVIEIG